MDFIDFSERLKQKSKLIDAGFYDSVPDKIELEDSAGKPMIVQPAGPLFAIYKGTVAGKKTALFMGLTEIEARIKVDRLNEEAISKRRKDEANCHEKGLEYKPDASELVLYDVVNQERIEERSPYYNPRPIMIDEVIL